MTVDVGLAPREGTPGAGWEGWRGTCYACPEFLPDGHPLVGDPGAHLREVGERHAELISLDEPEPDG